MPCCGKPRIESKPETKEPMKKIETKPEQHSPVKKEKVKLPPIR